MFFFHLYNTSNIETRKLWLRMTFILTQVTQFLTNTEVSYTHNVFHRTKNGFLYLRYLFLNSECPVKPQNSASVAIISIVREWDHSKYCLIMNMPAILPVMKQKLMSRTGKKKHTDLLMHTGLTRIWWQSEKQAAQVAGHSLPPGSAKGKANEIGHSQAEFLQIHMWSQETLWKSELKNKQGQRTGVSWARKRLSF